VSSRPLSSILVRGDALLQILACLLCVAPCALLRLSCFSFLYPPTPVYVSSSRNRLTLRFRSIGGQPIEFTPAGIDRILRALNISNVVSFNGTQFAGARCLLFGVRADAHS
jgi:hypothetical protein